MESANEPDQQTITIATTVACAVAAIGYFTWGRWGSVAGFFVGSMVGAVIGMAMAQRK